MTNTSAIEIFVRGRVVDTEVFRSALECERYKNAVRTWAREKCVLVSIMTTLPAPGLDQCHWLLPARAV